MKDYTEDSDCRFVPETTLMGHTKISYFVLLVLLLIAGCGFSPLLGAKSGLKPAEQSIPNTPRNTQLSRINQWQGVSQGGLNRDYPQSDTIDPGPRLVNMHRPEIVLTAHSRHERLAIACSMNEEEQETLVLGHEDDYLSFKFSASDYSSPDKNKYHQKLNGFNDEWIDPQEIRSATYTGLAASNNVSMVKAANNHGTWNEEVVSIKLEVDPPPWQTPWAFSIYTLLIGGTLVTYKKNKDNECEKTKNYDTNSATYTSLPAGNYVFTVKAANNDGIWNEEGVSIQLQVEPPPWQTPWAFSMYTLFIGGTLVTYKRKQDKKHDTAKKYSAKLEGQVKARTQELSERYEELKELNQKLQEASVTDSLTGLKNRRYLYESIETCVASITRRVEDTMSGDVKFNTIDIAPSMFFMMIDLDGFKSINDTYGHAAGDMALIQVRDILQETCRKSDIIVRWGGDEFLIVGENTSLRAAEQLAERIRHNLAEHQYQLGGGNVGRLSGSIGFSMYPFSPLKKANLLTWEQIVALADHSAYTAKNNGRNAWVGVYGTRKSAWEEFAKTDVDVVDLAAKGMLSIRSSHDALIETVKKIQNAKG